MLEPVVTPLPAAAVADPGAENVEPAASIEPTPTADVAPAIEPPSTAASTTPASKPSSSTSSPKKPAASKPSTSPKPEPTPAGAPVTVHFRLEGGIDYAEVKIAGVLMPVDKRFDSRVASGEHTVKWRLRDGKWKSGRIVLGTGAEWKIWVSPTRVRAEKL
jgi:hypothetical protein